MENPGKFHIGFFNRTALQFNLQEHQRKVISLISLGRGRVEGGGPQETPLFFNFLAVSHKKLVQKYVGVPLFEKSCLYQPHFHAVELCLRITPLSVRYIATVRSLVFNDNFSTQFKVSSPNRFDCIDFFVALRFNTDSVGNDCEQ